MKALLTLAFLLPISALAASGFDGTWKTRLDSVQFSGKPDVFEIVDGIYSCDNCVPAYKIKVDGTDQPVPGHAYVDMEAVNIVSPSTVEFTDKKAGKIIFSQSLSVSADGSKLTSKFTSNTGEKPITGSYTEKRLKAGPHGSHAISGTWQQDSLPDLADAGRSVTLSTTTDGLKMIYNGQTTDAKFDGKQYPTVGDPGKTMVSLKKVDDRTIEETDRRLGKVTDVIVWSLAADGKTISLSDTDPQHETKTTSILDKQ